MSSYLPAALIVALLGLLWFAYQYFRLRRKTNNLAHLLRKAANAEVPANALPLDIIGLENLSNAIAALAARWDQQLFSSEAERARLAAVLEQMTDAVLIVDAGGRIQFANPATEKIFETPHIINHTVAEVLRHHQLVEAWRRCQQTGEMQSDVVELPARKQYLQIVAVSDKYAGGALLLVQDLTRLRRLETVRRDFISNVSHELRTPLASLKALTETLQDGALDDPGVAQKFLARIETEVDALAQMATELLDLSRIESGQIALTLESISPLKLIASAVERMKLQAERANLTLSIDASDALPLIRADQARLEQVLVNLIHNAVKFTPSNGVVTLAAERDRNSIRFMVRDTGIGIPMDDLTRIFERFYRVDRARSGGGTGLGLSIAKHLVEAHGGKIWAESVEGKGSSFYFTIPQ